MAPTQSPDDRARRNAWVVMAAFMIGSAPVVVHHLMTRPPAHTGVATAPAAVVKPRPAVHGPVDIGFAQDMTLHHEQALTMARVALMRGSPRVKMLAQGIVNQQLKEIGYLQGWLMLWDAPGIANAADMRWMKEAYAHSTRRDPAYDQFIQSCDQGQGMPGLASSQELEALDAPSKPDDFDRKFLALMVRHHQGAIVMAQFTAEHADLDLVRGFARAMAAEQQQEMAQMLAWLRSS